jgi:6-phosphogluconolactonase
MPQNDPEVVPLADADAIAQEAARRVLAAAEAAVAARGAFTLVLAGGSTPEKLYRLLAAPPLRDRIPWERTRVFLGDERFVPYDAPESNWGMAQRTLLDHVPLPVENLHPMPTTAGHARPEEAAQAYDATLRALFPGATPPRFDLVLLGLGDDGHTASLFPGKPALDVADAWAAASPPGVLPPPVDRITLTFPVLNAARATLFLVAGAKKAPALRSVLSGAADIREHPAAGVRPEAGTLTFLADAAALAGGE